MADAANPLPSPQDAYQNLLLGVHNQVFFQKLASAGIAPRTADEAAWALETSHQLRAIEESQQAKQAAARGNPFFQMKQALDELAPRYGVDRRPEADLSVKRAAAHLAQDPVIYNSILALKAAQATELVAQAA